MLPQATKEVGGGSSSRSNTTRVTKALARALEKQGAIMVRPLHEIEHGDTGARSRRQGCIGVFQLGA